MQAPSTTRVLRSPSSSVSTQPLRATLPRLLERLGPVLPALVVEQLDPLGDAVLVVLVGEVGAERAAPGLGSRGVDAGAAVAEDARPARGQPGQVAAEHLLGVGRVLELDPGAGKDEIDLGHVRQPYPRRSEPASPDTVGTCASVCSTSAPTRATCSSSTPTAARRRCRPPPTRSRCGSPSTSTSDGTVSRRGVEALDRVRRQRADAGRGQGLRGDLLLRDLGGPRRRQLRRRARPRRGAHRRRRSRCCRARTRRG